MLYFRRRNQNGDYLLGENKGPEATPMKDVNRQEPIDKTNDVEPLIGVTSDGKQPYKKLLKFVL